MSLNQVIQYHEEFVYFNFEIEYFAVYQNRALYFNDIIKYSVKSGQDQPAFFQFPITIIGTCIDNEIYIFLNIYQVQ